MSTKVEGIVFIWLALQLWRGQWGWSTDHCPWKK